MGKKKLIKRWDSFLEKIEERFDEILEQSEQATAQVIEKLEYDSTSIMNAWEGIELKLLKLQDKAEDAWSDKMDDLFGDRDDVSSKERYRELFKYEGLNHEMQKKYVKTHTKVLAEAGRKIYNNVINHIDTNKIHSCKQCGDQMNIEIYSFMAKNIKCDSCGTVNSYEPDSRIQALEAFVIDPLAEELVLDLKIKQLDIEHAISRLHDNRNKEGAKEKELKLERQLIDTKKEIINKYYSYCETNIPDKAPYFKKQKEERLQWAEDKKLSY